MSTNRQVPAPVPAKLDLRELALLGYDSTRILRLVAQDMESRRNRLLSMAAVTLSAPTKRSQYKPAPPAKPTPPAPAKPPVKPPAPKRTKAAQEPSRDVISSGTPAGRPQKRPITPKTPKTPKTPVARRPMSPEARARIVAAQKARWAAYHEAKIA